eukprot:SM000083S22795  [mRNA]  locus=s83:507973:509994:- [translate_table: standard]
MEARLDAPPRVREAVVHPAQIGTAGQLLAGGIAGAVSKTCTAPLARLTILFQVQGMHSNGALLQRPSMAAETARILREEGLRAFWKGNAVTIVHRLPYSSINFFAYEKYKAVSERASVTLSPFLSHPPPSFYILLRLWDIDMFLINLAGVNAGEESLGVGMGTRLLAGGGAGITAASLTYPLDLVRTRLAVQTKSLYYSGILGTLSTIVRDEGTRGLYKGMGATLLGVGPNIAINFCVYETLKNACIAQRPETPPFLVSLGCGSVAAICSSTATFPLDLVRRRMQLEGAAGRANVYKPGIGTMFTHIVRTEGWLALYRGIVPEYYKVVPGVSIAFMTYEFMKWLLRNRSEGEL